MIKLVFKILIFVVALFCLIYLFFFSANILLAPSSEKGVQPEVCYNSPVGENCFLVELAKTTAEREKGLMYRTYLEQGQGMLFIFEKEGIYPFYMKNTLIPLDIIWMDAEGKVVFMSQNTQPCKVADCLAINPETPAKYVLEINAGLAEKTGIKPGSKLDLYY